MTTLHLVCPQCETLNRIPADRVDDQPKCGQCKQALFSAQPIELVKRTSDAICSKMAFRYWWTSGRRGAGRAG